MGLYPLSCTCKSARRTRKITSKKACSYVVIQVNTTKAHVLLYFLYLVPTFTPSLLTCSTHCLHWLCKLCIDAELSYLQMEPTLRSSCLGMTVTVSPSMDRTLPCRCMRSPSHTPTTSPGRSGWDLLSRLLEPTGGGRGRGGEG